MSPGAVGALAASIGVPIVMALLAKWFPGSSLDSGGPSLEELRPRYQKWETLFGVLFLIACVPITLGLSACLTSLAEWHAALLPSANVVLTAMRIYWLLPAMFLSMVVASPIIIAVEKAVLRDRYQEFERYQALKYRVDQAKVTRFMMAGVGSLCGLVILLGLDWYVLITPDEVILNRFLSLSEERYTIDDIETIRSAPKLVAPNGKVVSRREWVVTFSGGSTWSTNYLPADLDAEAKGVLIGSLAEKSGIPVQEVEVFEDGEG